MLCGVTRGNDTMRVPLHKCKHFFKGFGFRFRVEGVSSRGLGLKKAGELSFANLESRGLAMQLFCLWERLPCLLT